MKIILNNTTLDFRVYNDKYAKNILNPADAHLGIASAGSVSDHWIDPNNRFYWYVGMDITDYPVGTTFHFIRNDNQTWSAKNAGFRGVNSEWIEDNAFLEGAGLISITKSSDTQKYLYISVDKETYPYDNIANRNGAFASETTWKPFANVV